MHSFFNLFKLPLLQRKYLTGFLLAIVSILPVDRLLATKLVEVQPVHNKCLVIHWQDGEIRYNWDDSLSGSCNGWDFLHTESWDLCKDKDQYIPFGSPLNTEFALNADAYKLISGSGRVQERGEQVPANVYRKSKVWEAGFDEQAPAMHHWIYLEFEEPMKQGAHYILNIGKNTSSDLLEVSFYYDEYSLISPSIKISNIGYEASAPHKTADVYMWMGDGGEADFSHLEGSSWHLFDLSRKENAYTGEFNLYMENMPEPEFGRDFTMADIWECDFSDFRTPGKYRLVIEGIGSSFPFEIRDNIFEEAYRTSMQGMFYQRVGCEQKPSGDFPYSRRPLFKQGVEPADFKVFISEKDMVTGRNPDDRDWYAEELTGEIAKETWGGWVDAYDNDQRPVNYICVFDLLMLYYLHPEIFVDNHLYIPEAGNGIPDLIDEALWEIDWWLRMRDSQGNYLTGLTNIKPPQNINYAGAPCAWQGWCVAAGCAMVADCFRLEGNVNLQQKYLSEAEKAYSWAGDQDSLMLDVDVSGLRGRDLKMTAAAFLYNLTGSEAYENVLFEESVVKDSSARILNHGKWEQQYASLAYINTPQKVSDPLLQKRMKDAFARQAREDYVDLMGASPTRASRYTVAWEGMMQTSNEMSVVAVAHSLSEDDAEREYFEQGMYAEAEWTLGRNPLGLVQMTGLTDRAISQCFAPGRRDGVPGLTPGWTPYMCRDGWMNSGNIVRCQWYTDRNYPENKEEWPYGEHFWNSRYNVPNGETTPQQTFRQKIVLYGYLWAMNQ